jgi:transcriptional regulator with XRE-family HTH domain
VLAIILAGELRKTLETPRHRALINVIIQKRQAAGLTQSELANLLGEYQSFVARLESGQRRLDVIEFIDLAEILKFDPAREISALKKTR